MLVDICDSLIDPALVFLKTRQAMMLMMARDGLIASPFRGLGTAGAYTRAALTIPAIIEILRDCEKRKRPLKRITYK